MTLFFGNFVYISCGDEKIIAVDRSCPIEVYIIYFMENGVSSFRMHVIEFFVHENPHIKFD